jgi:hypothetical protein
MSLEQLVFIALFILVPLVRALAERRQKRRQEEAAEALSQTTGSSEIPDYPSYEPPAWPAPAYPAPTFPAPPQLPTLPPAARVVPTPSARPPAPEPPRRTLLDPARNLRAAYARTHGLVPQNRAELRRALLLVEILGPPRSLERHER